MSGQEKCPECGANALYTAVRDYDENGEIIYETCRHVAGSVGCRLRQLAQAQAERDEARATCAAWKVIIENLLAHLPDRADALHYAAINDGNVAAVHVAVDAAIRAIGGDNPGQPLLKAAIEALKENS